MKRRKRWIALACVAVLAAALGCRQAFAWTPGAGPGGVAVLEKVMIGGMEQWMLARGKDASAPVLLWLHGGPGSAQMPVARHYNGDLERDFIVVQWDQRGAGKSNPAGFDESTMSFRRYVTDVHEMTQYLKARFHRDKIYLLGHSWGTQIGLAAAHEYPQDYAAYIAVSQVVSPGEADGIACRWLRGELLSAGEEGELRALDSLGPPPYRDHEAFVRFIHLVDAHGGGMDAGFGAMASAALLAPEYRWSDYARWMNGANRGSGPMWGEMLSFDAGGQYPSLSVPVYFFCGERDYNTPMELVQRYCDGLDDPAGKQLVVFEKSAHAPFFAEAEKFHAELNRVRAETAGR